MQNVTLGENLIIETFRFDANSRINQISYRDTICAKLIYQSIYVEIVHSQCCLHLNKHDCYTLQVESSRWPSHKIANEQIMRVVATVYSIHIRSWYIAQSCPEQTGLIPVASSVSHLLRHYHYPIPAANYWRTSQLRFEVSQIYQSWSLFSVCCVVVDLTWVRFLSMTRLAECALKFRNNGGWGKGGWCKHVWQRCVQDVSSWWFLKGNLEILKLLNNSISYSSVIFLRW